MPASGERPIASLFVVPEFQNVKIPCRAWRSRRPSSSSENHFPRDDTPQDDDEASNSSSNSGSRGRSPNKSNDGPLEFTVHLLASSDHKPEREDEKARIEAAGGFVSGLDKAEKATNDCPRLDGNLAVSRGFGDYQYKMENPETSPGLQKVSCVPELYQMHDVEAGNLVLLACDGIFDVMSNEELVNFVLKEIVRLESKHLECSFLFIPGKRGSTTYNYRNYVT